MTYANKKKKKLYAILKKEIQYDEFSWQFTVIFNQFSVPLGKPQKKVLILMAGVRP